MQTLEKYSPASTELGTAHIISEALLSASIDKFEGAEDEESAAVSVDRNSSIIWRTALGRLNGIRESVFARGFLKNGGVWGVNSWRRSGSNCGVGVLEGEALVSE